jgi:hypothetical protein
LREAAPTTKQLCAGGHSDDAQVQLTVPLQPAGSVMQA